MIFNKSLNLIRKSVFILSLILGWFSVDAQTVEFNELQYRAYENPRLIKIDTFQSKVYVAALIEQQINIQMFEGDSLKKLKEVNIPIKLGSNEKIAEFVVLHQGKMGVLLKSYTSEKIWVKSIHIEAPGLISKPKVLLELINRQLNLVIDEKNSTKAVNKQVQFAYSPNKKFFSVVNRQNLVCTTNSNELAIHNFDHNLHFVDRFNGSNCAYENLHIFNNGKIAFTQNEYGRIVFQLYDPYFKKNVYTYLFPEITGQSIENGSYRQDTFDQQVQFYYDDTEMKVYAFIKGFVNNNYITHIGMYVYDINQGKQDQPTGTAMAIKELIKYNLTYRDFYKGYSYEYPMHLRLRYIKKKPDGTYEMLGDYMSYGAMPLGNDFAGVAQSEATYIIHLDQNGRLISTKILLHKQSILSYPSDSNKWSSYEISPDRVDNRVGQIYLYDSSANYVLHNEDKNAFINEDRLYRYVYYGNNQSVAVVQFTPKSKGKTKNKELSVYTLLPQQTTLALNSNRIVCFATRKKKVKLLLVSLAKP